MKALTVLGTRPEIIKLAPLVPLLDKEFDHFLTHSGQHYAYEMDRVFFEGLSLREPDETLEVGSLDGLAQTALIMERLKPVLDRINPDLVVVQGDTNSTLAGALAAAKAGVCVAHVEAGCRSFNRLMPEELNRVVADHVSDFLFAPYEDQAANLSREGIDSENIYTTGSTLIDICLDHFDIIDQSDILTRVGAAEQDYVLVTIHRAENTDDMEILSRLIASLNRLSDKIDIVFPIHPRTRKALAANGIEQAKRIRIIDPLGYVDFLRLLKGAQFVMTDSGGIQEEAALFNVPGLILREETEWPNFLRAGKNKLVGRDPETIVATAMELLDDNRLLDRMRGADLDLPRGASLEIARILQAGL